jgi:hypothetical protein
MVLFLYSFTFITDPGRPFHKKHHLVQLVSFMFHVYCGTLWNRKEQYRIVHAKLKHCTDPGRPFHKKHHLVPLVSFMFHFYCGTLLNTLDQRRTEKNNIEQCMQN